MIASSPLLESCVLDEIHVDTRTDNMEYPVIYTQFGGLHLTILNLIRRLPRMTHFTHSMQINFC